MAAYTGHEFSVAKYHGKWAVYDETSRTYSFIGCGRAFCEKCVKKLNEISKQQEEHP